MAKGHVVVGPGRIMIQELIDTGGILGDAVTFLKPNEEFEGWTYEELKARGSGEIEIPKPK